MSIEDFREHIDGQAVQVIYHGGCPDGCLSGLVLRQSIKEDFKASSLQIIPTSHSGTMASEIVEGSTVIFSDCSPTIADEPELQKCRCIIVLDHHASVTEVQQTLQATLPQMTNLSDASGPECGATLAIRFTSSRLIPEHLTHLFHKLDVFSHPAPADVMEKFNAFKGFITKRGFCNCTVEMVEELLADETAALTFGLQRYERLVELTKQVFASRRLLAETDLLEIWAVDWATSEALDLVFYQELIDAMPHTAIPATSSLAKETAETTRCKALVFATMNRTPAPNRPEVYSVGVRRGAGDELNVGTVAKRLGECRDLKFKGGGGHPYAAGAQCSDFDLPLETLCAELTRICADMLETSPELLPEIANEDTDAQSPSPKRRQLES